MDDFDRDEMHGSKMAKKKPITEDGAPPEGSENTLHIPVDFVQGTEFKPGDKLMVKVVAVGDDGLEVAYATEEDAMGEDDEMDADAELTAIDDGY